MGQIFTTQKPEITYNQKFINFFIYMNIFIFSYKILKNYSPKRIIRSKVDIDDVILDDIIGLESVKDELRQYMDFIKNSGKYKDWDVKIPRGILLSGPPGTGKTLLVRAIAKSLDIPIIAVSGAEFVEKYVGVGAARIRKLFNKARDNVNCIIFIDEIDAIGIQRDFETNSERATTLNQ